MFGESGHGGVSRLIVFDHVDCGFECLFMDSWWERWRVIKANENTNVEELIFRYS